MVLTSENFCQAECGALHDANAQLKDKHIAEIAALNLARAELEEKHAEEVVAQDNYKIKEEVTDELEKFEEYRFLNDLEVQRRAATHAAIQRSSPEKSDASMKHSVPRAEKSETSVLYRGGVGGRSRCIEEHESDDAKENIVAEVKHMAAELREEHANALATMEWQHNSAIRAMHLKNTALQAQSSHHFTERELLSLTIADLEDELSELHQVCALLISRLADGDEQLKTHVLKADRAEAAFLRAGMAVLLGLFWPILSLF